jgi:hypothetical protein
VGLTVVEPLADADVNVPGAIDTRVAPVVVQLSMLLLPELILAGLAAKELITGKVAACTETVTVAFTEPAALLAVNI